jgi:outer membrane protein TolC
MTLREVRTRLFRNGLLRRLLGPAAVAVGAWCALPALPAPPPNLPTLPAAPPADAVKPDPLSPADAIRWALANNPDIAALRQQHGIAEAGLIIAKQYPFNPFWETQVFGDSGPPGAATNAVPVTNRVTLELEVRGQPRIRREAAAAALSRTDWEIANQEVALAVRVVRAFDTVVYRFRKRKLFDEIVLLNQRTLKEIEDLLDAGRPGYTQSDAIVLRAEVEDSRAQIPPAQTALVTAWYDLYRLLGIPGAAAFDLRGGFETPPPLENDADALLGAALERRPDLRAHQVAVNEADARVRLEVANRYGNPNIGPVVEYNESRVAFMGVQATFPLPVLNTHRGEIQQREAERTRAVLDLRQNEVVVRQDVRAALARLEQARRWVNTYRRDIVPGLEKHFQDMQKLYEARAGGAELLRVLDVQRRLLKARDVELDAIFELRQALADLALAIGDPSLAAPCPNP